MYGMQAGTWWVDDDAGIARDVIERFFARSQHWRRFAFASEFADITTHFAHGILVNFDEGYVFATDRQADGANAAVEVDDFAWYPAPVVTCAAYGVLGT